jgi:hypothetical protein
LTNLEEAKPENKNGLEVELENFIKENKDHIDEKLLKQLLQSHNLLGSEFATTIIGPSHLPHLILNNKIPEAIKVLSYVAGTEIKEQIML